MHFVFGPKISNEAGRTNSSPSWFQKKNSSPSWSGPPTKWKIKAGLGVAHFSLPFFLDDWSSCWAHILKIIRIQIVMEQSKSNIDSFLGSGWPAKGGVDQTSVAGFLHIQILQKYTKLWWA